MDDVRGHDTGSGDAAVLVAGRVVASPGHCGPARIHIDHAGLVREVEPSGNDASPDLVVVPGFVDLQVNGLGDIDVATAGPAGVLELARRLARHGVAAWLPTIVTRPVADYPRALDTIDEAIGLQREHADPGAQILGVHLEGPFLGDRPGAHPAELLVPADPGFASGLSPNVRLVTLAPEVAGAAELTAALRERGVIVAIGHTAATREQLDRVHASGATLVTHLFNAMTGVHHRDHGVATWAMLTDSIDVAVIGDGHHVRPEVVELTRRVVGHERLILVSDSVAHLGRGLRGGYAGHPATLPDGTIAGSTATMADAAAGALRLGWPAEHVAAATSANAARLLGAGAHGTIRPGSPADLVVLEPDGTLVAAWVGGRRIDPAS